MPEKEYIERDKLIDDILHALLVVPNEDFLLPPEKDIVRTIKSEPAADVRPVVLCRDCKYTPSGTDDGEDQGFALEWPHDDWPEDNPCPCKCADGWYSHKPAPDFFCASGEKREENNA